MDLSPGLRNQGMNMKKSILAPSAAATPTTIARLVAFPPEPRMFIAFVRKFALKIAKLKVVL